MVPDRVYVMSTPTRAAEHCRPFVNATTHGDGTRAEGPIAIYVYEARRIPDPHADPKGVAYAPHGPSASAVRLICPRVTQLLARWD